MKFLTKHRQIGKTPFTQSLSFILILGATFLIALQLRGVNLQDRFFVENKVNPQPSLEANQQVARSSTENGTSGSSSEPTVQDKPSPPVNTATPQEQRTPSIALHPLNYFHYGQRNSNAPEVAELITSLLTIDLGNSSEIELLDRSMVGALFDEKTLLGVEEQTATQQATLEKLPVSNFTLVGSLFSDDGVNSYNLKLVDNLTGQILGAARFPFTLDSLDQTISDSSQFIHRLMDEQPYSATESKQKKLAVGHFVDIGFSDEALHEGRAITNRLIEHYVGSENYSVLARTQVFPVMFENYLRILQYKDENGDPASKNADYVIHGSYEVGLDKLITAYLYLDTIDYGRELILLKGDNWNSIFDQVNEKIELLLANPVAVTDEQKIASEKSYLDAVVVRNRGREPTLTNPRYDISGILSNASAEEIAETRRLLEFSAEQNPNNLASKIALAVFAKHDGDLQTWSELLQAVIRTKDPVHAEAAYAMHGPAGRMHLTDDDLLDVITRISGPETSQSIYQLLMDEEYLEWSNNQRLNEDSKADEVFNRSTALTLGNFDREISIQVFEQLRARHHVPGYQITHMPMLNNPNRNQWRQKVYRSQKNTEATLHLDLAKSTGSIYVKDSDIPIIEFHPDTLQETEKRRRANLDIAIDGFASSAYIDKAYIRPMVLLGHSMCHTTINRCASGNMVNNWVVDNANLANVAGRSSFLFNDSTDLEENDGLIFLAADAVDRVKEVRLGRLLEHELQLGDYFINKINQQVDDLAEQSEAESNPQSQNLDLTKVKIESLIAIIKEKCDQLENGILRIGRERDYVEPMQELAALVAENPSYSEYRTSLLAQLENEHQTVYPFLVVGMSETADFVAAEQDEMVRKVVTGEIVPLKISEFKEIVLVLFHKRLDDLKVDDAEKYIGYLVDFYGESEETAMDLAYLYYKLGDLQKSDDLFKTYGKHEFTISDFSSPNGNGVYRHQGFTKDGQLHYINENSDNYFSYNASSERSGLGERDYKWKYHQGKYDSPRTTSEDDPELFHFGNRGYPKYFGIQTWAPSSHNGFAGLDSDDALQEDEPTIATDEVSIFSAKKEIAEGTTYEKFLSGAAFDSTGLYAIQGAVKTEGVGPLLEEYFSTSFLRSRDFPGLKDRLFELGYIASNGIPIIRDKNVIREKLENDFPEYTASERRNMQAALVAATEIYHAGQADIYQLDNDGLWVLTAALPPPLAQKNGDFGRTVAIENNQAFVCDAKGSLYIYSFHEKEWQLSQELTAPCGPIATYGEWLAVGGFKTVFMYKQTNGLWQQTQSLKPDDYLIKMDQGYRFERFGQSLAMTKDSLIAGSEHSRETYIFTVENGEWSQSQLLTSEKHNIFYGRAIAVSEDFLAIGTDTAQNEDASERQRGVVFIYKKSLSNTWEPLITLFPDGRPANVYFGRNVSIRNNDSLLVESRTNLHIYDLPNK